MKNVLILLVMAIAFVLVASSCTKEEPIVASYGQLEVGLVDIDVTYKVTGLEKFTFAVPDDAPQGTSITLSAGKNRLDGQSITALVGSPQEVIIDDWTYVRFSSYKTEKVEITSKK